MWLSDISVSLSHWQPVIHFEIGRKANGWNKETMAVKLPTLLEGEALAVWLELNDDEQKDYDQAKEKLVLMMTPAEFVSLDEFHLCKIREKHCRCFSMI